MKWSNRKMKWNYYYSKVINKFKNIKKLKELQMQWSIWWTKYKGKAGIQIQIGITMMHGDGLRKQCRTTRLLKPRLWSGRKPMIKCAGYRLKTITHSVIKAVTPTHSINDIAYTYYYFTIFTHIYSYIYIYWHIYIS